MYSWYVLPRVGEIEVLSDEESAGRLSGSPHDIVILSGDVLVRNRIDVVAEVGQELDKLMGQVLVQLDVHRPSAPATGRSSCAEAAANAMAARTSISVRVGKSLRISSVVAPSARLARIVRKVTLVPLITACPPATRGSRWIRS